MSNISGPGPFEPQERRVEGSETSESPDAVTSKGGEVLQGLGKAIGGAGELINKGVDLATRRGLEEAQKASVAAEQRIGGISEEDAFLLAMDKLWKTVEIQKYMHPDGKTMDPSEFPKATVGLYEACCRIMEQPEEQFGERRMTALSESEYSHLINCMTEMTGYQYHYETEENLTDWVVGASAEALKECDRETTVKQFLESYYSKIGLELFPE